MTSVPQEPGSTPDLPDPDGADDMVLTTDPEAQTDDDVVDPDAAASS